LGSALDRLSAAGLLFQQGLPPQATYLFKHALVQDAAYGTLLREQRRTLHARIAETLEVQFADITENQPELLARHCTEAGLIEKAANVWGKAGQRSLARSALVEAAEQLTRALGQIATLPATPVSRREQIKLQVALINALFHVKGYSAPETKAAVEQARLQIEQAEALGEAPEDPLLLFSVLYGLWVANLVAFNSDVCVGLAIQFLSLAEKAETTGPLMVGHQILGISLQSAGKITEARAHYDQGIALYDGVEHRALATRFGQDSRVVILSRRSAALWLLGYPDSALADADHALTYAREIGHAPSLLYALNHVLFAHYECGKYAKATATADELLVLAENKGTLLWKAWGLMHEGCACALNAQPSDAVRMLTDGFAVAQFAGATLWLPFLRLHLARAYIELGNFEDAWRYIREAMTMIERTAEAWCEAEVYRTAGEITLLAPKRDAEKGEAYFNHALALARSQQAKSWELRVAMSMAHYWRDQGKPQQARDLLAPVYGRFTEGFDTRDLREAKALLDTLVS
jgi:predicted ATPase